MKEPLVIRASAGTGKTYRLSLEFINLLLKYRISFEEILVITFTRKATAEIRERIFEQLKKIVDGKDEGEELKQSFRENIDQNIKFNSEEIEFLKETYKKMITAKSSVKISTIDSFVNNIFSGIIAPFNNIQEFRIDNKINQEILPEIFNRILTEDKIDIYKEIFLLAKSRNLDQFRQFILDIIENRWLFEFLDREQLLKISTESEISDHLVVYTDLLQRFLEVLEKEIIEKKDPIQALLRKDFYEGISRQLDLSKTNKADFREKMYQILADPEFLNENFSLLLNSKNPWNGRKIKNEELNEIYTLLKSALAEFLYYHKAVVEQLEIISLAADILNVYDEIKFRDRTFTHSDISYYTFRYLYDPDLSLIDQGNVMNVFYEQLSYSIRFVLIDEFQDTSILQWSIFKPILKELMSGIGQKEHSRIIIVGDEKQAIYGWRGGERKLLTSFSKIMNSAVKHNHLITSYRSKPLLMDWLNRCFSSKYLNYAENWTYTDIKAFRKNGGYIQVDFRNRENFGDNLEKLSKYDIYRELVQNVIKINLEKGTIDPQDTVIIMRKNSELKEMAQALDESGIDYVLDTSGSLFQHKAVKPVIFILNFLVYEDLYQLMTFLRSDLVLMYPKDLRELIKKIKSYKDLNEFFEKDTAYPVLEIFKKLRSDFFSIQQTIKLILEHFRFTEVFNSEIDLKNLLRFLEVAAEFERTDHEYTIDLNGFLKYCRAIEDKDEFSQIGQAVSDSIKLFTIHKSKGLQFETVFAVFDASSKPARSRPGLKFFYDFADNFNSLQDFAFTYNYEKVMKNSHKQDLIETVNRREFDDELNNIYVALTRTKNNLFLYLQYSKKGNIDKFFESITPNSSLLRNFSKHLYLEFKHEINEISPTKHNFSSGEISKECIAKLEKSEFTPALKDKLDLMGPGTILVTGKYDFHKLKTEIMKNNSIQIGNIVHEFFSHIKYDTREISQSAANRTIAKYGNLVQLDKLNDIVAKAEKFMENNAEYFDKNNWDKVFTEYVLFDENGREYRVDRLMIDTENKRILIVDYKTGSYYEQEQLDRYKRIIEGLPYIRMNDYKVSTKFLEIELNSGE